MRLRPFFTSIHGPVFLDPDDPKIRSRALTEREAIVVGVEYTEEEFSKFSAFQVIPRKLLNLPDHEESWNTKRHESDPLVRTKAGHSVRLWASLAFENLKVPAKTLAMPFEIDEFVLAQDVADAFAADRLESYELRPIRRRGRPTEVLDGVYQLYTARILGLAVADASWLEDARGNSSPLGCLAYSASEIVGIKDFARTAEPFSDGSEQPFWVVSSRVRDSYRKHKLKGWDFRPVLPVGSKEHSEYTEIWRLFRERTKGCRLLPCE